jgi:hypothetical protein
MAASCNGVSVVSNVVMAKWRNNGVMANLNAINGRNWRINLVIMKPINENQWLMCQWLISAIRNV